MRKRHRPRASKNGQSGMQLVEHLEGRVLLATARQIFSVGNIDTSAPTSTNLYDIKGGPMSNVGGKLTDLYVDYRRFRKAGGVDADYVAPNLGIWTAGSKVGVTIRGLIPLADLTNVIRSYGGGIVYRTGTFNAIDAIIPITMLHEIAVDPAVATINPISNAGTSQAGVGNNQADETQVADLVRSTFGVDGTGVKIGVISDSVNQVGNGLGGSVATGDLPGDVQVISDSSFLLNGGNDTDEGRAMLELIHDVAPGAKLAFATALGGQQAFADSIRALRAAGCDIIVDDYNYFDEPFFQPGIVAQAIADVVAGGAIYLTAAGNSANDGFETPVTFSNGAGARFVDWDTGPQTDTRLRLTLTAAAQVKMQWDDPYNGIAGNVGTDLDVYAYRSDIPTRIAGFGTANNLRTGIPVETMVLNPGVYDIEVRIADFVPGRSLPTRLKMVFTGIVGAAGGEVATEYHFTESSIIGHSGAAEAISVGAVPFFNASPYGSQNPLLSEDFSSTGTVTQVFDASGNRLPTPLTLLKPDISGIDGINTSFFTGSPVTPLPREQDILDDPDALPNFFGTSAAAPNVAASLALIRQAAPNISADAIRDVIQSTATPLNGQTAGSYDPQAGFGLINTFAAIESFASAPVVQDITFSSNPAYGRLNSVRIVFSQQVSGFNVSDLRLTFEDQLNNLLTGGQDLVTTDGGRTWVLSGLGVISDLPGNGVGTYTLTLFDSEGDIVNAVGVTLQGGGSASVELLPAPQVPAAPSGIATKAISQSMVRVRWTDNSGLFESGFQIERSESINFLSRVTRFNVGANVTVFTDDDPSLAGKQLYYRVRAFNAFGQFSSFSEVSAVTTPSPGEIILDNESSGNVIIAGTWNVDDSVAGFLGSSYLDDLNAGKGTNSVTFTPNLPADGSYFVYARWTRANDRATNVPIDISGASGLKTITVNQRDTGGAGWVLLGKFSFKSGKLGFVKFRTDGTDGRVIVDAVRFLPAG